MSKVGLKRLANDLNISISTVSKALRGSYEISENTKKKVIDAAQRLGYNPNPYAGSLRLRKSKTVAIIVPELNNNFFMQAIEGAESIAQQNSYHILIYTTHDDLKLEESILNHLQNGRVDGVIMSLGRHSQTYHHINSLIQSGIPIVFFDRVCHEIETVKIITDDFMSGFNATEHLIQNGCTTIAYLSISKYLSIDNKRKQGYFEALNKYNISVKEDLIVTCDGNEEDSYQKIKELLTGNKKIDGIFTVIERLAFTTYHVCKELNISIPGGVKIISFSNLKTASLLNPPLSSVTQPAFEMGRQAAAYLFKNLDKRQILMSNENIVLKSELVIRQSSLQKN